MAGGTSTIDAIAELLHHDAPDRRIAAAIVLGELQARGPEVIRGLIAMLESGAPALQRPALQALARIGAPRAVPAMLALTAARDEEVRRLAVQAVVACGESVLEEVRARLPAAHGEERKALDAILARFADRKEAAAAILQNLGSSDPEVLRNVPMQIRPIIKDADRKTRRMWLAELKRFLDAMRKHPPPSPMPVATAVKILGWLEDDEATDLLLEYARDPRAPFAVRQEALIALRQVIRADRDDERAAAAIDAMVQAAEDTDRMLAQAALMGLAVVELPARYAARIARLAVHPDPERARIAIEALARQPGSDVTRALVDVIANADRRRGELAARALESRPDAGPALASALAVEKDVDRANLLRFAIKPHARTLPPAARRKLVEAALDRLAEGRNWQVHVDVARDADPETLAAGLRKMVARLRRSKNDQALRTVLGLLTRTEHATDDERYQLAALALRASHRDTRPAARQSDEALQMLVALADRGFDVARALRNDGSLELAHLYYAGFHFVELGHPVGQEILGEVAARAGRTKLGKMARNKLALGSAGET